jgi:hypothetical protein
VTNSLGTLGGTGLITAPVTISALGTLAPRQWICERASRRAGPGGAP